MTIPSTTELREALAAHIAAREAHTKHWTESTKSELRITETFLAVVCRQHLPALLDAIDAIGAGKGES